MTQFYNHQAFTDLNDSQKEAVKNLDGPLLVPVSYTHLTLPTILLV